MRIQHLIIGSLLCLLACGAPAPAPHPVPPPAPAADMVAYCNPCCVDQASCGIACVDCQPDACEKRTDGQFCCNPAKLRVPPDGGSLCTR